MNPHRSLSVATESVVYPTSIWTNHVQEDTGLLLQDISDEQLGGKRFVQIFNNSSAEIEIDNTPREASCTAMNDTQNGNRRRGIHGLHSEWLGMRGVCELL